MGLFPSMTQLRIEAERNKRIANDKRRDDIIKIVCALVSSNAEYDTFSEAIDEAILLYNEITERI